jgi:hypothetical protein
MGKRRYNPLANLHGFVNLTNKKIKTANLKAPSSNINVENHASDSEKENVSSELLIRHNLLTMTQCQCGTGWKALTSEL